MSGVAAPPGGARREVHCVVLAAGLGRRLGGGKLLLPFGDSTLLERAVSAALGSGAGRTVVVLGHQADIARGTLEKAWPRRRDLALVVNRDYRSGQAGSVRVGLAEAMCGSAPRAVVFVLADQPLVTSSTVSAIIDAYLAAAAAAGATGNPVAAPFDPLVAAPVCGGRRGNPVLFDRRLFSEIAGLTGDTGPRAIIDRCAAEGRLLAVPAGPEVLVDLDTEEDYARWLLPGSAPPGSAPPGAGSGAGPDSRRPGSATS